MKTGTSPAVGLLWSCVVACCRTLSLDGTDGVLGPLQFSGVSNISSLLLDEASGILYLGAQDTILSLQASTLTNTHPPIIWQVPEEKREVCKTKGKGEADCHNYILVLEFVSEGRIYACGTHAFDPQCVFIITEDFSLELEQGGSVRVEPGKGKCPFDPRDQHTAVMADGILYSATTTNFMGTAPLISRATGSERERVRTEESPSWLSEPVFVSSALIRVSQDNPTGDEDKIFFFFTEVGEEYDFYRKVKVARVARVCKGDVGGMKTLQKRWTSFLKAGLVCEDRASGERYSILSAVFSTEHQPGHAQSTHFYTVFSSQREHGYVSAVCVYSVADISRVMEGPFKQQKDCDGSSNPETALKPRPGQCITSALKAEGFESSLNLPDDVLSFVRDHPLMENSVVAAPLMVRRGIAYTKIAVTLMPVSDADQNNTAILHLGTDTGELHRILVGGDSAFLLQEIPLFNKPVNNILLHQDQVVVSSQLSVARVLTEGCGLYPSCETCSLAPCVWREGACKPITAGGTPAEGPKPQCENAEACCSPEVQVLQVRAGLRVILPCVQVSPRPCFWTHPPGRHTRLQHWDMAVTVTRETVGSYTCFCQEGGAAGEKGRGPCRRAAYELVLEGDRLRRSVYLVCLFLGLLLGVFLVVVLRKRSPAPQPHPAEGGRGLLRDWDAPVGFTSV